MVLPFPSSFFLTLKSHFFFLYKILVFQQISEQVPGDALSWVNEANSTGALRETECEYLVWEYIILTVFSRHSSESAQHSSLAGVSVHNSRPCREGEQGARTPSLSEYSLLQFSRRHFSSARSCAREEARAKCRPTDTGLRRVLSPCSHSPVT